MASAAVLRPRRAIDDLAGDLARCQHAVSGYHDRMRTPSETLRRIRPLLRPLGVTRVGLLTGLDVVGIPVAFATRPNSFSLSVFQGKGIDVDGAMASAAMEAVETRVAETPPGDLTVESFAARLRRGTATIDLDDVHRCVPEEIDVHRPTPWCEGLDLLSGDAVAVPWGLVGIDHRVPRPPGYEQSSDGLASGNSPAEAVLHGLCELVERDAWTLARLRPRVRLAASRVDPRVFRDPVVDVLVTRIESAGMTLVLLDITSDIAIPAFMAIIVPAAGQDGGDLRWSEICGGCGCHPSAARAAIRAITEAAQSRLTVIAGSRDDLTPRQYQAMGPSAADHPAVPLAAAPFREAPADAVLSGGIQGAIAGILSRLAAVGIRRVVAVPLGDGSLPVSVVRVIAVGLEVDLDGAATRLGARAARALTEAAT
jgi:ribosomal protein S12 methylthiotransferase accessory factor